MSEYMIREDGKNGTVQILPDRIVRTIKKVIGKDDVQTIPTKAVAGVQHNRKTITTDQVTLVAGIVTYKWKVRDAEGMVADLNASIYG